MTLFPQTPRYTSAQPDIGFYYPALDYTVAVMDLAPGASVTVEPGTAIGVRHDYVPVPWGGYTYTQVGFGVEQGASFVSHGTPTAPIVFTSVKNVQEIPETGYAATIVYSYLHQRNDPPRWPFTTIAFVPAYTADDSGDPAPTLDFRFSHFYLSGLESHIWAGAEMLDWDLQPTSDDSSVYLNLQDCELHNGALVLGPPDILVNETKIYAPGTVSLINNLFDRAVVTLDPTWYGDSGVVNSDMTLQAYNNLFRGGWRFS